MGCLVAESIHLRACPGFLTYRFALSQGGEARRSVTLKKIGVLNKDISEVIAGMGHMDMLVIGDAGLPIPRQVRRIDLAVKEGVPGFLETVEAIAAELKVQQIILAEETGKVSPHIEQALIKMFDGVQVEMVNHAALKELCKDAVAVVRTGEFTPYANVILVSGVVF
jgi:D-ribose pyranase